MNDLEKKPSTCDTCKKEINKADTTFICAICTEGVHSTCIDQNKKVRTSSLGTNFLANVAKIGFKWICDKCSPSLAIIHSLIEIRSAVSEMNSKVNALESALSKLSHQSSPSNVSLSDGSPRATYAEAVKGMSGECALLISSTALNANDESVRDKIIECVNPNDSKVSNLINLDNHSCILKSKSNDIDKLEEDLKVALGSDFEVKLLDRKLPKIKIVGFSNVANWDNEEIISSLISQNDLKVLSKDIKIVKTLVNRRNEKLSTLIVAVPSEIHKLILGKRAVSLMFNRCSVYDAIDVPRCFKCSRLGHYESRCNNNLCCAKCSGEHKLKECESSQHKCINCVTANEKFNRNHNINHAAFDRKCPSMLRRLSNAKKSYNQ